MSASDPRAAARAVLERSVAALGPPEAVAAVHSIRGSAHCRGPRGEYTTLVESARGNLLRFEQRWPNGRRFLAFTRGAEAWTVDSDTNTNEPLTPEIRAAIRSHEFQMLPIEIDRRFSPIRPIVDDQFTAVAVTDELGLPGELRFEPGTGRWHSKTITNYGRPDETVTTRVEEWREISGVMFPSCVVASDSSGDFVLDFESIEVNVFDEPSYGTDLVPLDPGASRGRSAAHPGHETAPAS